MNAFLNNILFSLRINQYSLRPEITELWTLRAKGQVADLLVADLTPDDQDCSDDDVGDNKTTNRRHLYCNGYTLRFGQNKTTKMIITISDQQNFFFKKKVAISVFNVVAPVVQQIKKISIFKQNQTRCWHRKISGKNWFG